MQQLLLDVFTPPDPSLGNFVPGNNAELLAQMQAMADGRSEETTLFVYGGPGCGKTHLLEALSAHWNVPVLSGKNRLVWRNQSRAILLDDAQHLTPYSQVQLFNAFNEARSSGLPKHIIVTANQHTSQLKLRVDLLSRMGWGLNYRLDPLSDAQKRQVLLSTAQTKGLDLDDEVIEYALIHFQRDMGSLSALLNGLDQFSLEQKKPVSLYLLRQWMKRREGLVVKNSRPHDNRA
jgi:DnaA family protein